MQKSKQEKSLLAKVLLQKKLDVVNLYHVYNASISILQDVSDELKEIIQPEKNAKKVANDFTEFLEKEIRKMQQTVEDEQLLTLQNNECMKEILQKIIDATKKGTVEKLLNLILDFDK